MKKENVAPAHELLSMWINHKLNSRSELASELNISRAAVSYWCSGHRQPSRQHAKAIEDMSRGSVPVYLWPRQRTTGASEGAKKIRLILDCTARGVSEAARSIGMSQSTLTHIVDGSSRPSVRSLNIINKEFKLKLTPASFVVRP